MKQQDLRIEQLIEYCTGCGLCHSVNRVEFCEDEKGFPVPKLSPEDLELCEAVCPSVCTDSNSGASCWGSFFNAYLGWSTAGEMRTKGSSGGVLTALCCFLLEQGRVDGIIQTGADETIPYGTVLRISRSREEVLSCAGSRYSISSPLYDLFQVIDPAKRYAFVGKPCDVMTLRKYMEKKPEWKDSIRYLFSFFCAGMPGKNAQLTLLQRLGFTGEEPGLRLQYRGNGWPGLTTAGNEGGSTHITYEEAWGGILGRDVRKSCKFCIDGVGEYADIVCADAWYIKEGQVDFTEHEGRNIIFARNKEADALLQEACAQGKLEMYADEEYVAHFDSIQKYQVERRGTLGCTILAMKLFGKTVPAYNTKRMRDLSRYVTLRQKGRRFVGTVKRIIAKKL